MLWEIISKTASFSENLVRIVSEMLKTVEKELNRTYEAYDKIVDRIWEEVQRYVIGGVGQDEQGGDRNRHFQHLVSRDRQLSLRQHTCRNNRRRPASRPLLGGGGRQRKRVLSTLRTPNNRFLFLGPLHDLRSTEDPILTTRGVFRLLGFSDSFHREKNFFHRLICLCIWSTENLKVSQSNMRAEIWEESGIFTKFTN